MKKLPRRTVLKGLAAAPVLLAGRRSWAADGGADHGVGGRHRQGQGRGQGLALYQPRHQDRRRHRGPVQGKVRHRRGVFPRRLGGRDVEGARGGGRRPHPGRHGRCLRSGGSAGDEGARAAAGEEVRCRSGHPAGPARSGRDLDGRPPDAGRHPVQHQRVRRRQGAEDLGGPDQARIQGPPHVLQQRQRRRRAAPLHDGQALRLGVARGACGERADPRGDAAAGHAGSGERRTRRGLRHQRQHRLALQAAGQAHRLRLSRRRACRPSRAPSG